MTGTGRLELRAGDLCASVDPMHGAAIRTFDLVASKGRIPLLAAACAEPEAVEDAGLFPMVPFANRVRNNRLTISGQEVDLPANTDDPLCLHGWAWQRAWRVEQQTPNSCTLGLRLQDHGYDLSLSYGLQLKESALHLRLSAMNQSDSPAPVGLGFHPYFPRLADTEISFSATRIWPEGPSRLPAGSTPVPEADDYTDGRQIPPDWRNECYSGWSGRARIRQPGLGYDLEMSATGSDVLMFYTDPALPRFALEPQTHVSGETHTGANGLSVVAPGQGRGIELTLGLNRHSAP